MADKSKKPKRGGFISEEDVSIILQRYSATTVLALLQEVAQVADVKIDWNALVKHTKTSITNPREYQTLWRHIAYRSELPENLEDDTKPLDDDSDLEFELEPFPTVSSEASAEAAACVKVLLASGSPNDSGLEKGLTIEAPLTINIPKGKSAGFPLENSHVASSMRGINITVPVSVPKQPLPTVTAAEGLDTNGGSNGNLPARRKRKPWSAAEDMELFAAVQKCGEGNWANILKGDFKGDRTASQLSQRWKMIKKRKSNPNITSGSQLSEVQLAARRALNMALDKPGIDISKAASLVGRTNASSTPNMLMQPVSTDPQPAAGKLPLNQNQPPQDSSPTGSKRSLPRTQSFSKRPSPKPPATGPDAVKAAAVAAGARIATQSAAAAILKAQLKGAIHIKTTGSGPTRPATAGAHLGSDYFRSISPNASRPNNPGSSHVGPVIQPNHQTSVAPDIGTSGSAGSPKGSVQEDEGGVDEQVGSFNEKAPNEQVGDDKEYPKQKMDSGVS